MILDLPFAYTIRCVPPGHVTQKTFAVHGIAPFEVPVVTSSDAPVSCERHGLTYRTFDDRSFWKVNSPLSVMLERLAGYDRTPSYARADLASHFGHLFEGRAASAATPFTLPSEAEQVKEIIANSKRGGSIRDLSDDKVARIADAATTWQRDLLVVDGELWVETTEPHLRVEYHGGRAIRLNDCVAPSRHARWSVAFRADRKDEAEAFGKGMASRVKGRFFIDETYDSLRIASPADLAFDEADALAASIWDGQDYAFGGNNYEFLHGLRTRRVAGDAGWARDFLDIPDMPQMVKHGPHRLLAKEKADYVQASQISLFAWHRLFREKDRIVASRPTEADEDSLAAMVVDEMEELDGESLAFGM